MIPNLQKILKEWSYRVGVVKPTNTKHLEDLKDILIEEGWSYEVTNEFIQNLTNEKTTLDEVKLLKNIVSKLKRVWTSLKSKIKSLKSHRTNGILHLAL